MPWLPFYASEDDFRLVADHLNALEDVAFIVTCGPGKWIAVRTVDPLQPGRHCLWQISSGPLPLLREGGQNDLEILDPFEGWTELRRGADPSTPYFDPGHPGVFWLNLKGREESWRGDSAVGLSSFEWIGNRYKVIGQPALPQTEAFWKALRRWIMKIAKKVPRGGPTEPTPPEIWALPGSCSLFQQGLKGGN